MGARRTLGWGCGGLITLLGLTLGGAWAYLHSDAGERKVEATLEDLIAGMLDNGSITVGDLELKGTTLTLTDVAVDGAQYEDVLRVPKIHAEVRLRSALHRTLAIESLVVDAPTVVLHRLESGDFDLPVFTASAEPEPPDPTTWMAAGWTLDLREVQLTDGSLTLPDDEVQLVGIALFGAATATEQRLELDELSLGWDVTLPTVGPGTLDAALTFDGPTLTTADAILRQGSLEAELGGSIVDLLGDGMTLDLQLDVTAPPDARTTLANAFEVELPDDLLEDTDLVLDAAMAGPLEAVELRAELAYDDVDDGVLFLTAAGGVTGDVHLVGSVWAPDLQHLDRVNAPFTAGSLQMPFTLDRRGEQLTAVVDAHLRAVGLDDIGSIGRTRLHAEGQVLPAFELAFDLDLANARLDASPLVFRGAADGTYAGTTLITTVDVDTTTSDPFTLNGALRLDTDSRALTVSALDLRASDTLTVQNDGPLLGDLNPASLSLDGRLQLLASDAPSGTLTLDVASRGERLTATLVGDDLALTPLTKAARIWVDAELPDVSGTLDAELGYTAMGGQPTVDVDASFTELAIAELLTPADASITASVRDDVLTADVTLSRKGRRHANLDATVPLVAGGFTPVCRSGTDIDLELLPTSLAQLRSLSPLVPAVDQRMTLGATLSATGDACDPTVSVEAGLATELLDAPLIAELTASDGPDHLLNADLTVDFAEEPALTVDLTAPHPAPADLLEADDPLAQLQGWEARARVLDVRMRSVLPDVSGRVGGWAYATGDGRWATSTDGDLEWSTPGTRGFVLERVRAGWLTHDGQVAADVMVVADDATNLEAQASVDLRGVQENTGETALYAKVPPAEIPLALLADLSAGLIQDPSGVLKLSADVDGTVAKPNATGELLLDNGALQLPATGIQYEDIDLDVQLAGERAQVTLGLDAFPRYGRFRNRTADNEHQLDLSGSVELKDDGTLAPDLTVTLDEFWGIANDLATTSLDGDLTVTGSATDLKLRGDLIVNDGNFELGRHLFIPAASETLDADITFVGTVPAAFVVEEDDSVSPMYLVDARVGVSIAPATRLRATFPMAADAGQIGTIGDVNLDAKLQGDLEVAMLYGEPAITGKVQVEGDASLLTAEFDIQQGTIAFIGADVSAPTIDLTLQRTGSSGDVTAVISGTPTNLQIEELTSSQGLTDADILAQFLFGRSLSDLGDGESATAAAAVQQALLSVAGSSVENALGVGLVDSVDYSDDGLALGWSVGGDGFLTVAIDPTADPDENVAEVTLSWLLGRMAEAELQTGDAGESAAWLRLETRF